MSEVEKEVKTETRLVTVELSLKVGDFTMTRYMGRPEAIEFTIVDRYGEKSITYLSRRETLHLAGVIMDEFGS